MTLLREIREQAYMTQTELAQKVGASPQAIYLYEKGKTLPRAEMQAKIAAVFGVRSKDIFIGLPKRGGKRGGYSVKNWILGCVWHRKHGRRKA